jgi:hypothetical protein
MPGNVLLLSSGELSPWLDTRHSAPVQVDVKHMGPKTRRELVETALGDAEDNEQFLRRVRERMDGYKP